MAKATMAEGVVIGWGQNNSLGSGDALSPQRVQGAKPPEAQRFSQIQPD